ncbi:hypothetical protein [Tateyamaria sp.]|uniref:hypothetical protein n=1 Tax=Tateyamaria sp. TaxID=1929288 RepID=UPI003B21F734
MLETLFQDAPFLRLIGIIAALLSVVAYLPYALDTIAGRTRPQRASWCETTELMINPDYPGLCRTSPDETAKSACFMEFRNRFEPDRLSRPKSGQTTPVCAKPGLRGDNGLKTALF